MESKIDGKQILKDLEKKGERAKVSFYLSKDLYDEFKEACGNVAASQVLQRLMEQFVESVRPNKKRR
jgi:hypothetical protein